MGSSLHVRNGLVSNLEKEIHARFGEGVLDKLISTKINEALRNKQSDENQNPIQLKTIKHI